MNLASLTTSEVKRLVSIFTVIALALAVFLVLIFNYLRDTELLWTVLQAIGGAVTLTAMLFGLLASIPWKWEIPAWLMGRPVVHGVWFGTLLSNHPDVAGRPIEIVLVIKQSYLALSIESYTATQEGESVIEALLRSAKTDATRLCYVYELRRQYLSEKKLTSGSGELRLVDDGKRLRGLYFTNARTEGQIDLALISRECRGIDCYDAAARLIRSTQPRPPEPSVPSG